MQAADNLPLYGVCCYMEEMVHRPPAVLASKYPGSTKPLSRYLVAAPRCYAFLTHFPFFALHMKVCSRSVKSHVRLSCFNTKRLLPIHGYKRSLCDSQTVGYA